MVVMVGTPFGVYMHQAVCLHVDGRTWEATHTSEGEAYTLR